MNLIIKVESTVNIVKRGAYTYNKNISDYLKHIQQQQIAIIGVIKPQLILGVGVKEVAQNSILQKIKLL